MNTCLQRIHNAILSTTQGMTPQQLQWHPAGKWSAAEILEHLRLTYRGTVIAFNRCLQVGKPTANSPTLTSRFRIFMVVRLGHMPKEREAPVHTRPKGTPSETIVPEVIRQIAIMDETILRCEERLGSRVKLVDHPILGPLSGSEWCKFHWVHARHHLRQIERLKQLQAET